MSSTKRPKHSIKMLKSPYTKYEGHMSWAAVDAREELEQYYTQAPPVVGKSGWYYDRINKEVWYECFGSKWTKKPSKFGEDPTKLRDREISYFKYNLRCQDFVERPASAKEMRALEVLLGTTARFPKGLKPKLQELMWAWMAYSRNEQTRRQARISVHKLMSDRHKTAKQRKTTTTASVHPPQG